jgi:hypothetical protein
MTARIVRALVASSTGERRLAAIGRDHLVMVNLSGGSWRAA